MSGPCRAALGVILLTASAAPAQLLNTQIVINGGAETGDTFGWISDGIEAIPALGGAAGFGSWTFTAGEGPELDQRLTQSILINTLASPVDAGLVRADFSLVIQSRSGGGVTDTGSAIIEFRTALGSLLDSNSFTDPTSPTGTWDLYGVDRPVPPETRIIRIILDADRSGGFSTDCFFDQVFLRLYGCNDADLAEPLGVLDFFDVIAFLGAFGAMEPGADLADPIGVFDFSDVIAFLGAFGAGCP